MLWVEVRDWLQDREGELWQACGRELMMSSSRLLPVWQQAHPPYIVLCSGARDVHAWGGGGALPKGVWDESCQRLQL